VRLLFSDPHLHTAKVPEPNFATKASEKRASQLDLSCEGPFIIRFGSTRPCRFVLVLNIIVIELIESSRRASVTLGAGLMYWKYVVAEILE
jgi:hypothetical protein